MSESIEQFSFELTASALAEQERALPELRARAGTMLAAFRGETLLAESDHRGVSNVTEAYRTAGIWIEPHREVNRNKIVGLSNWLAATRQHLV